MMHRYDGDVQRAALQVFAAEGGCGGGQRLHLGMGRRIGERLDQIMAASHDRAVGHDHRADGHFLQL